MEFILIVIVGLIIFILVFSLLSFIFGLFLYITFDTFYKYTRKNGYHFSFVKNDNIDNQLNKELNIELLK